MWGSSDRGEWNGGLGDPGHSLWVESVTISSVKADSKGQNVIEILAMEGPGAT